MYFLRKYLNKPTMLDLLEYIDVDSDTDLIAKVFERQPVYLCAQVKD